MLAPATPATPDPVVAGAVPMWTMTGRDTSTASRRAGDAPSFAAAVPLGGLTGRDTWDVGLRAGKTRARSAVD